MATSQQALVRDSSTLTNYKQWAKAISDFFITAGWVRSSDTGQVNWSTIATVPSNSITRDYDIFQPGDGLQNFYVKVQYGTGSGSVNTNPVIAVSIGTATNGAGVLSGFIIPAFRMTNNDPAVTSTSVQYQCYFSGDSGRMCIMMWRDDVTVTFTIQRSLNSSGVAYGTASTGYVTLVGVGADNNQNVAQYSLVFGAGINGFNFNVGGNQLVALKRSTSSDLFAGSVPISPVFPDVGLFDNPMDAVAIGSLNDFTEGAQYVIPSAQMPYGVTHTYVCSKHYTSMVNNQNISALLMRYD